ncbi:hypothetical protein L0Z13_11515 [Burkholderia multivorans]|uniref:hypothetical protein n=1 Tax=Burkholderia multivorans TaxID=87883 RepID=UPI0009E0D6AF|nr:hypothetical protein [Burkholderia multivorans]MCO1435459.1 hypothetical protein [Burkholderia multivorans]UQN59164.1 hypothetical protein L0Y94_21395 [Burkholderia multivorans]UQN67520.1 hypothetical protein L0Y92_19960 [Burkholderia multivorans]UQO04915.1 hypothetical protein L0Z13_11195 [Burkholderia multivorans]UQO04974.1 hypothetical protein L0Z13_11515 [Burkholderia multivorans]
MKKFLISALLALTASAHAATKVPVLMLDPTGSTVGQAVLSNGPSAQPSWQSVTFGILPTIAANTVLGNSGASSATPGAVSLPSCSTASSALKYTSGTGFSCGTSFALTTGTLAQFASTTSAQIAGVVSDETGSGALVFGTSPSLTTPTIAGASLSGTFSGTPTFSGAVAFTSTIIPSQTAGIVGTTTNNNANAGSVGEYSENTTSGIALTNGVTANATSISLTAGDWDVSCEVTYTAAGGATPTAFQQSISTTSATGGGSGRQTLWTLSFAANSTNVMPTPRVRLSLSGTTTTYCTASALFGSGTVTAAGFIRARRVR